MKFLLPSRVPQFDFQFQLLASQHYWTTWKHSPLTLAYEDQPLTVPFESSSLAEHCPVGSLEFCSKHGISTLPRNIPPSLLSFAAGEATSSLSEVKRSSHSWHIKSSLKIKHPSNGPYKPSHPIPFKDGQFQAIHLLQEGFISEFRTFFFDGKLVGLQNYSGDLWQLPDKATVLKMASAFENAPGSNPPPAYTLDVGLTSQGQTCIIELHDFYSCGTYQFDDHYRLPLMLYSWWRWHKQSTSHL